ncbi:MAG: glycosyltransferase family 4 protein [Phycisphaerales bacterium]
MAAPSQAMIERWRSIRADLDGLSADVDRLGTQITGSPSASHPGPLEIFNGYIGVFVVAFLVTLAVTPLMRRLAIANGVVDRPGEARKLHKVPIAYLGGVGVYFGIVAGVLFSYLAPWHGMLQFHAVRPEHLGEVGIPLPVPYFVMIGMTIIMVIGLLDDVSNISPWQKVGGQLLAAALLAMDNVGVKIAYQVLYPIGKWMGYGPEMAATTKWVLFTLPPLPGVGAIEFDVVYWTGTAIIAIFVLGACNASNLIDGLDGLLSGTTAIASTGLLIVALGLAAVDAGPLDASRIVLCLALLGGCLGFLPHNFNPAVIFLGDSGSLLLGFTTIVVVLTLGDQGRTDLVLAGLVIYALPILDTVLAIIRRKLSGKRIADADDQHLHHMFKQALGVKGAVLTLYGIGALFAVLGVLLTMSRARITYTAVGVIALFICVMAIKVARRRALEEQLALAAKSSSAPPVPAPPTALREPAGPVTSSADKR